jgi:hypothetical protein
LKRNLVVLFVAAAALVALLLAAGLTWANSRYARAHPDEKDFLVPWLAARTFLQYGESPYGEPAAQRAQIVHYGRIAAPGEDPLYLWLPLPIELFYFPLAMIPNYAWARGLWMTICEAALVGTVALALRMTGWKASRNLQVALLLFGVFWIYGWLSLVQGGTSALVALSMAGLMAALRAERDELAGALLLPLLLAPRSSGVFVILILWWIIRHRRWKVFSGLLMLVLALMAVSFLVLPDWVVPAVRGALSHSLFTPGYSSIALFASWSPGLGLRLAWLLAGILLLLLLGEWGIAPGRDFRRLLWIVSLTLAVTPFLGIPVRLSDHVLLLLPLVQLLTVLTERWPGRGPLGTAWIVLGCIFVATWSLPLWLAYTGAAAALVDVLVLFPPLLLIIGLYWMRWWIIRTPRSALELPE